MKFNLYIPHPNVLAKWQLYAEKDRRSLSDFIRLAVYEKITKMDDEKETANDGN